MKRKADLNSRLASAAARGVQTFDRGHEKKEICSVCTGAGMKDSQVCSRCSGKGWYPHIPPVGQQRGQVVG